MQWKSLQFAVLHNLVILLRNIISLYIYITQLFLLFMKFNYRKSNTKQKKMHHLIAAQFRSGFSNMVVMKKWIQHIIAHLRISIGRSWTNYFFNNSIKNITQLFYTIGLFCMHTLWIKRTKNWKEIRNIRPTSCFHVTPNNVLKLFRLFTRCGISQINREQSVWNWIKNSVKNSLTNIENLTFLTIFREGDCNLLNKIEHNHKKFNKLRYKVVHEFFCSKWE